MKLTRKRNMTQAIDPVQEAIDAAANMASQPEQQAPIDAVPVSQGLQSQPAAQPVQTYAPPAAPSLDALSQGAMNVDGYLKVRDSGLKIDNKTNIIETVRVAIKMSEFIPVDCIRFGDPATYLKTYDGVTCSSGGSWAQALAKAATVDNTATPYSSVDIQMLLLEDAKDMKGEIVVEAGTRLGHSTAVTNKGTAGDFYKSVKEAGLENDTVEVEIGFRPMSSPKGYSWGIITFLLVGKYDPEAVTETKADAKAK